MQPSGHFNVSRAREFFLDIKSGIIGEPVYGSQQIQQGRLITEASAINFLLVSDGSAVLRYSTWLIYYYFILYTIYSHIKNIT